MSHTVPLHVGTRWLAALFLALTLSGCAAHPGIARGHEHVAAGRYRDAYAEYRRAVRADPDDEEARRLVEQLRPFARDEASRQTQEALGRGDYASALKHARYVEKLDPPMGRELVGEVEQTMRASLEALLLTQKHERAYPLAVRAARLFPHMRGLGTVFGRLRAHYRAKSQRLAAAGDFEGALAALDVIEEHEPALSGELAAEKQAVRERWADALVAQGRAAEGAGQRGIAAARFARAFEVAGRENDGDRMRQALRELAPLGRFQLGLELRGANERAARIEPALTTRLAAFEGVALASADEAATMHAVAALAPLRCSERRRTVTREQDYVSGYRDVQNPVFVELTASITRASEELSRHERDAESTQRDRDRAADDVDNCVRREEQPAADKLAKAEQRRERIERKVERQREEVRRLESQGDRGALERAREELRRLEDKANAARQNEQRARDALDQARNRCDRDRTRLRELEDRLANERAEAREARDELRRLENERIATPPTISEPVMATYRYDVTIHKRSCGGDLTLTLERSWSGPDTQEVSTSRTTRDESHAAHPTIDLSRDRLAYTEDDESLQAGADDDAAEALAGTIRKNVEDYYARIVDRAIASEDANGAASVLLAIGHVAPKRLTPAARQRLTAFLRDQHGIESLELLRK